MRFWNCGQGIEIEDGAPDVVRVISYASSPRAGDFLCVHARPRSSQKKLFPEPEPEWVEVNASAVRVEKCRQFGGPWLALELIKTLGLDAFLRETIPSGREDVPWSVIGR